MVLQVDCVQLQDLVMGRKDYLDRATVREEVMMSKSGCWVKGVIEIQDKDTWRGFGAKEKQTALQTGICSFVLFFCSSFFLSYSPFPFRILKKHISKHYPDMPAIPAQSQDISVCELCPEMPGWNTQAQINAHRRKSHIHTVRVAVAEHPSFFLPNVRVYT
ncbi:hypothetical protein B0T13DRAFT_59941 [Neurospora crassa]|nr:hypothetical protein B0T13DRAFT_59941 [Neurospora crassa]